MRGKVGIVFHLLPEPRITPAYAGKRYKIILYTPVQEDHPRLCGEKVTADIVGLKVRGSPPPMRGKACSTSFSARSIRDHPRLCGEKLPVLVYPLHVQGSPPPMRGKAAFAVFKRFYF